MGHTKGNRCFFLFSFSFFSPNTYASRISLPISPRRLRAASRSAVIPSTNEVTAARVYCTRLDRSARSSGFGLIKSDGWTKQKPKQNQNKSKKQKQKTKAKNKNKNKKQGTGEPPIQLK
jgi:hypothetical protein